MRTNWSNLTQFFYITQRWGTEQPAVFVAELRRIFVTHLKCRTGNLN